MRTWDQIVGDLESLSSDLVALTDEAREKADTDTNPVPPDGDVIHVAPGEDLQAALNAAPVGAVVELDAGGVYPGRVYVNRSVHLRTAGAAFDRRVTVEDGAAMARLADGLDVKPATVGVLLTALQFGPLNTDTIVNVGAGDSKQATVDAQPVDVFVDQCLILGHEVDGAKRGIGAHAKNLQITRTHIGDIFRAGQDTQAVGGWNGEGPFLIDDCCLEGAGENVMFGGSDPAIPGLIPGDITIRRSTIRKPLEWKQSNYTIKNLIEFKCGRRIVIEDNVLENSWAAGQAYGLVITPSQYGKLPESTVEDYTFCRNVVTGLSGAFNILGHGQHQNPNDDDYRPTQTSARITITDNYFVVSKAENGGQGWFMQIGNGPIDLHVEHNTIEMDGNQFIQGNKPQGVPGFRFVGNIVRSIGEYGTSLNVNGTDEKDGAKWREYFPDGVMEGNAYSGDESVFRNNFPDDLHTPTAESGDLIVDGYGVGIWEGYGRRS